MFSLVFREGGREGGIEGGGERSIDVGEKHGSVPLVHAPTGDHTPNPGVFPDGNQTRDL